MKTSYLDFLLCGGAISLVLLITFGLMAFGVVPLTTPLFGEYHVIVDFLLVLLVYGVVSALLTRLMLRIRPLVPGEYSMDSAAFAYWKLLTIVYRLGQAALIPFTPVFLKPVVESLFGAKIGPNVALGGVLEAPFMLAVCEGAVLGRGSLVSGNVILDGKIRFGHVTIGKEALVGINATVLPGVTVGEKAHGTGGAIGLAGSTIPDGETWRGIPARKWM